ncbi:D-isomer specific 2-hydroxyacid dehydrogenase [Xylariomycetidae sp. FL0641]|nr:D-isomer specific 2-hydroxyacid dehydrogenase [Xylariomycetidae sp. FL0641]
MKPTARVLNVARGGVYNEEALLKALDEGWIAAAGIDVFTQEPPPEGSIPARLMRHEKVVATPHLGASTVEAQENVSVDVCTQVLTILRGGLPTAAVNAPLILPDEYRKLQPFVALVERMGGLYTQHFSSASSFSSSPSTTQNKNNNNNNNSRHRRRRFELVYHGDLAGVANTRPLFAALVRGLLSPVSDAGGRDVNIVNAAAAAREKGLAIHEVHEHETTPAAAAYASLVTLRALSDDDEGDGVVVVIEGYVAGNTGYIARLGRFVTARFAPEGTLLILHNFDQPGKIGGVGLVLGRHGINITFMQVAGLEDGKGRGGKRRDSGVGGADVEEEEGEEEDKGETKGRRNGDEALMILGVDGDVGKDVLEDLGKAEGILRVSLVRL